MELNKRRRSRVGMIVLVIVLILLVLLGVFAYWQRDNIKAVYISATNSQEELEQKIQQNEQAMKDTVAANPSITIREITEEEREALRNGTLTMEELQERLKRPYEPLNPTPAEPEKPAETGKEEPGNPIEPSTPSEPSEPEKPVEQEQPTAPAEPEPPKEPALSPEEEEYQQKLNDILARVYILREEFSLKLDDLQKEAVKAFQKIKEDKSGITEFISSYFTKALALESECDGKMDAILAELTALQKEYGKDMELVGTVAYTYANEKSLKKAWYMNELQRRGLI